MIGGVEALWAWTPPGAEEAAIELGRQVDSEGADVWPKYTLDSISGAHSLSEGEDNATPNVGRRGETPRLSQSRGKTVAIEGKIKARTLLELREAEAVLRETFANRRSEGRFDVTWHPLMTAFSEVPAKFFEARALSCDIVDQQDSQKWERLYVVTLRNHDGRYFDEETETYSVEIANTNEAAEFAE